MSPLTAEVYRFDNFPAKYYWPAIQLLRARAASECTNIAQISNCGNWLLELGNNTPTDMFDIAKLKQDGCTVTRRPIGGDAVMVGTGDVPFSFHINKLCVPSADPAKIYYRCLEHLRDTIEAVGVKAEIAKAKQPIDGQHVCIAASDRGEIIDAKYKRKITGVLIEDDGLIVGVHGVMAVTWYWSKVYDYMDVDRPPNNVWSLESLANERGMAPKVMDAFIDQFDAVNIGPFRNQDFDALELLSKKVMV